MMMMMMSKTATQLCIQEN